jgi:hypothetical protein
MKLSSSLDFALRGGVVVSVLLPPLRARKAPANVVPRVAMASCVRSSGQRYFLHCIQFFSSFELPIFTFSNKVIFVVLITASAADIGKFCRLQREVGGGLGGTYNVRSDLAAHNSVRGNHNCGFGASSGDVKGSN